MSGLRGAIAGLLRTLHDVFPLPVYSEDLLSTVTVAGGVFALSTVFGALLIALLRKFTGNRYNGAVVGTLIGVGLLFFLVLPGLGFAGTSAAFREPGRAIRAAGLGGELAGRSPFVTDQSAYLGSGPSVSEAIFHPASGPLLHAVALALLVAAPILAWLFVLVQARCAVRRGPRWPGRLLWVPFVILVLATGPLNAHVVAQLWIGFTPVSLVGILVVLIVGTPRHGVLYPPQREQQPPPPEPRAAQAQPPRQPVAPQQPPPHQPPQRGDTRLDAPPREPEPVAALADTPGPLPFGPAAAAAALSSPAPAAQGRFRRVRTLGSGGFGTVWMAVDTQLDRTVAVKFAHVPDAETEQRMLREARALAAVRHPNCVHVYDIVTEPDGMGIVMEYIDGNSLSDAVRGTGRLNDIAAGRLWASMAGALAAAHDKGVLHRDVKPSNVIIDESGVAHLIDFGIARTRGDATLTATGMMVGTPDFLAPETANGDDATPASDSWQLAATVSYALSGHPPRGGRGDAMAAFYAASRGERCSKLPRHSAHYRLLSAVLDGDPAERPTLDIVRHELSGWLARTGYREDGPILPAETSGQHGTRRV